MKLLFNLNYITSFGEELALNILSPGMAGTDRQHRMMSANGHDWQLELSVDAGIISIDYYYSVIKNGEESRHEWMMQPHRLILPKDATGLLTVYDHWIDIPEDAPLYTSVFAEEVKAADNNFEGNLLLKVRAPQLRANERLAVMGDDPCLGGWEALKAVEMKEIQPHEWVVALDTRDFERPLFEFKFVALDDEGDVTPLWEEGGNRSIFIPELQEGDGVAYELSQPNFPIYPWRAAGTVIPVFSLRSEGSFGVGDFGDLKMMVDWVVKTRQRVLQVLPINDTTINHSWQDSYPYNSISIYALHPQYTDLRQLPLLADEERRTYYEQVREELNALDQIDYERVNRHKMEYLRELFAQEWPSMSKEPAYKKFFERNRHWLVPYAAFCHYRDLYGTAVFSEWPDHHELAEKEREAMAKPATALYKKVAFWYFVQYNLDTQMRAAHDYARSKGVVLKGDIPIGISRDGVEAWMEPRYFNLNGQAGAPPDAFSTNGQNWGFPTYNWEEMLKDGCSWWVRRFTKMAEYFDAYRIDHVLGFFRIWEIPLNAVHGLLGQFSPALGMTREEIESYGLHFQEALFTKPFIRNWTLDRIFGDKAARVKELFLNCLDDDVWEMKPEFDTQRKVEAWYRREKAEAEAGRPSLEGEFVLESLRDSLYALISDVLFVHDRKDRKKYHPRIGVQNDFVYESLYDSDKFVFNRLYNDYFYRRNNQYWYQEAMKKLPRLTEATRMLVCAEDLGMVPDCVPWVMDQLRILSLEIQSMPKDSAFRFGHLSRNPYRSVCTISTHDMPTLRQWWDEDHGRTQDYYNSMLHRGGGAPHPLPGWLAKDIVSRHLTSPSMLCLLSLQDWLSIDESLRLADANAERINIPANPRHYWRYRMHLTIEQLMASDGFNYELETLVKQSGRK